MMGTLTRPDFLEESQVESNLPVRLSLDSSSSKENHQVLQLWDGVQSVALEMTEDEWEDNQSSTVQDRFEQSRDEYWADIDMAYKVVSSETVDVSSLPVARYRPTF